jgi:hypothetical protein
VKLEDRLRRELHDTAEHLIISPDKYEEIVRVGRRRRRAMLASGVAGIVAIAAMLAVAFTLRSISPDRVAVTAPTTIPASDTTAPVVMTPAVDQAVVVARPDGISVEGLAGDHMLLESDLYYEGISWVISDGAGGLIYQHDVTPLPWVQGTVMRLPAGAPNPQAVVAPPPGGYLRPLDVDNGILLYRQDVMAISEVIGLDLATGKTHVVVPATDYLIGASVEAGEVVAVLGGDCSQFAHYGIDGSELAGPSWDDGKCLSTSINDVAFTGQYLYTLEDSEGRQVVRRDFATGERRASPVEDGWQIAASADGTVAIGGTEIRVGRFDGDTFEQSLITANANSFALAKLSGLSESATLGSNLGELPCTPLDVGNPELQGLPELVERRRMELFSLAAACDMETLATIARADGIAFTYGGETDPLRSWIRSARSGYDVMTWIVRLFNSTPAVNNDGSYVWPAVHVTNSEEDWQQLSGILSAAEFEQYYSMRETGYMGLRIGIAADGTWLYVIAGD